MAIYSGGMKEIPNLVRTGIWLEPKPKSEQKVSVVYYLSRNGKLEHPHFIEVPLSSPPHLYLRDVMNRMNFLRGQGMANTYFWSSKRSYKNGFVWQDLSEDDIIYPSHGTDYILKGSILEKCLSFRSYKTTAVLSDAKNSLETTSSSEDASFPAIIRRKNHSWSTLDDLVEHKIINGIKGIDVSRQTEDKNRRRGLRIEQENKENHMVELREEISCLPSSFNSEATNSLKAGIKVNGSADIRDQAVENDSPSRRIKMPTALMQLIMCGSKIQSKTESIKTKD